MDRDGRLTMPKLASFKADLDPSPVTGWWNTDRNAYRPPPPEPNIEMTEEQWTARLEGHWAVSGGKLLAYDPPPTIAQLISERIKKGLTLHPSGAVLSLMPNAIDGLRVAALDAAAGFGLPNGAETFDAVTVDGATLPLTEDQVVAAYKGARNLLALLRAQHAIIARGETPAWPEQTIQV
jgi:hypothetical protein